MRYVRYVMDFYLKLTRKSSLLKTNKYWLNEFFFLSLLLQPTQMKFKQKQQQQRQQQQDIKQHSSGMKVAPREINCISVNYNTFIYAYMPHTYASVD